MFSLRCAHTHGAFQDQIPPHVSLLPLSLYFPKYQKDIPLNPGKAQNRGRETCELFVGSFPPIPNEVQLGEPLGG